VRKSKGNTSLDDTSMNVSKWLPELIFLKCIHDLLVSDAFINSLFIPIHVSQYALSCIFYEAFTIYRHILDGSHL